jgi:hypothetical protein
MKKEYIIIGILLLAVAGYFYWQHTKKKPNPDTTGASGQ